MHHQPHHYIDKKTYLPWLMIMPGPAGRGGDSLTRTGHSTSQHRADSESDETHPDTLHCTMPLYNATVQCHCTGHLATLCPSLIWPHVITNCTGHVRSFIWTQARQQRGP